MNHLGAVLTVVAVIMFFFLGFGIGLGAEEKYIADGCNLQGSFIIDDDLYDCTLREAE